MTKLIILALTSILMAVKADMAEVNQQPIPAVQTEIAVEGVSVEGVSETEEVTEGVVTESVAEGVVTESVTEDATEGSESSNAESPAMEVSTEGTIESQMVTSMVNEINALRVAEGLNPLNFDPVLADVASIRAKECSICWSHTRPDGTDGLDLIPLSYEWAGENLSFCKLSSVEDMTTRKFVALKNSPKHLENMVAPEYNNIGVAAYYDEVEDLMYMAYCFGN